MWGKKKEASSVEIIYEEKLSELEEQEKELQFEHFANEDALMLGLELVKEAQVMGVSLSVEIRRNHSTLFFYRSEGTSDHNCEWLRRKANTVDKLGMSTLRLYYDLLHTGRDLAKDLFLNPDVYAARGGGFPLTIRGTGVVGSICVSALPHEKDHALLVRVIRRYLEAQNKSCAQNETQE